MCYRSVHGGPFLQGGTTMCNWVMNNWVLLPRDLLILTRFHFPGGSTLFTLLRRIDFPSDPCFLSLEPIFPPNLDHSGTRNSSKFVISRALYGETRSRTDVVFFPNPMNQVEEKNDKSDSSKSLHNSDKIAINIPKLLPRLTCFLAKKAVNWCQLIS